MGQGILLSEGTSVDFMIHGVFSYELFGQTVWITTTHVCVLIVMQQSNQTCNGSSGHIPECGGTDRGNAGWHDRRRYG